MAAPASKTIGDLNGKWVLNKTLSDSVDPALSLQGVSWLVRKAIGAATVTLETKQYQGPATPPNTSAELVTRIDIQQVATAGVKGTAENRCLDNEFREHSDWLFGRVRGRTRWVGPEDLAAHVGPDGEARRTGVVQDDFAARDWLEGEGEKGGPLGETHMLNHVESLDAGWTALQVWGFQNVGGERRYVRNVVVAKNGTFVNFKMVYDWVPE
ncbi:hypothetical protein F4813DRAFT_376074 [Daldinia decipiens]|uniref:uncharacterized protein n=1 Tax=Daldinia decipiens TaxID=326647 RepID=UPI0020C2FA59|nr:uncharacterized protein F4813DRAFT_376074 [Daldinia decipiens]KAI1653054.1 hypothetical protein F4813DRAFT_376074 [Daldinia decipiens]